MENLNENSNEEAEELQVKKVPAPPRLNENIIYLTIEKMFFALGREGNWRRAMDLRSNNAYTQFMTLNRVHFNAMLAQFAKMERINIYWEWNIVNFYRNKDHILTYNDTEQQGVFSGPYEVTKHFVSRLIHYEKLRTSHVRTDGCLTKKESIKMSLEGKKPLEIFSALFLDKVIEVPGNYDLQIKKLEMDEEPETIDRHFDAILALNSDEIVLRSFAIKKQCLVHKRKFKADLSVKLTTYTTKKITFYQNFSTRKPKEEFALLAQTWTGLILHLAKVCPNLSQLDLELKCDFGVCIADDILDGVLRLVETVQGMLSELANGSQQLKIHLVLCLEVTIFHQSLPSESHELFQLGNAITWENVDTPHTARAIKMADKLEREHEFVFKIIWYQVADSSSGDSDPSD